MSFVIASGTARCLCLGAIASLLMGCGNPTPPPNVRAEQSIPQQGQTLPIGATVSVGEETIQLEVAETPEQQSIGLMFRSELASDRGMLFPFEPARRARFWMRNVSIPLDMIFLHNNTIVDIAAEVPPCESMPCPLYGPAELVDQVIELAGGRAAELNLTPGMPLEVQPVP